MNEPPKHLQTNMFPEKRCDHAAQSCPKPRFIQIFEHISKNKYQIWINIWIPNIRSPFFGAKGKPLPNGRFGGPPPVPGVRRCGGAGTGPCHGGEGSRICGETWSLTQVRASETIRNHQFTDGSDGGEYKMECDV